MATRTSTERKSQAKKYVQRKPAARDSKGKQGITPEEATLIRSVIKRRAGALRELAKH